MELQQILTPERTLCHADSATKKSILELASNTLATANPTLSSQDIATHLVERERLGSTGIGYGVAIPHARIEGLDFPIACLIHLDHGIDFASSDDQPVDLIFAFIVPEGLAEEHLDLISTLATLFNEESFRDELREAKTDDSLYHAMIDNSEHAHAR